MLDTEGVPGGLGARDEVTLVGMDTDEELAAEWVTVRGAAVTLAGG
jgi:hypothetical protein